MQKRKWDEERKTNEILVSSIGNPVIRTTQFADGGIG